MQCACYIAESDDNHPLRLNPCPEHERWAKAIRDAERAALAKAMCRECERGDTPVYVRDVQHWFHGVGEPWEIGCTAASVHNRSRT